MRNIKLNMTVLQIYSSIAVKVTLVFMCVSQQVQSFVVIYVAQSSKKLAAHIKLAHYIVNF